MSHNSQGSIRAELEVLPCSCLRRPQPLCRTHLPQHGPSHESQIGVPGVPFVIYKVCDPKWLQGLRIKSD
jgi:hypothetical protein